jgi:hypothetical protein
MSAMAKKLLSSGEFCKLLYDTIPVKSESANVSFYTNKLKMPYFKLLTFLSQMSDILFASTATFRIFVLYIRIDKFLNKLCRLGPGGGNFGRIVGF